MAQEKEFDPAKLLKSILKYTKRYNPENDDDGESIQEYLTESVHSVEENLYDFFQINIFGFCGCGSPEENVKLIYDGLKHIHIDSKKMHNNDFPDYRFSEWQEDEIKVFGNHQSAYFFYYWADVEQLTEHGGSVPGWLTDKGEDIFNALTEFFEYANQQ